MVYDFDVSVNRDLSILKYISVGCYIDLECLTPLNLNTWHYEERFIYSKICYPRVR